MALKAKTPASTTEQVDLNPIVAPVVPSSITVPAITVDSTSVPTSPEIVDYQKIFMSEEEKAKFLDGKDANLYFRGGEIPKWIKKGFGDLLPEDREEVIALRDFIPHIKDLLLFKHQLNNIYTLLVPKYYAGFEIDSRGEFIQKEVRCDTRVSAFTGAAGRPTAFQRDTFKKDCDKYNNHFVNAKKSREGY